LNYIKQCKTPKSTEEIGMVIFTKGKTKIASFRFSIPCHGRDGQSHNNVRCVNKILFEEGAPYEYCNILAEYKADGIQKGPP